MPKALLVTPYWPPVNKVGVWRVLRAARYLPEYQWTPTICTPLPEQVYKQRTFIDDSFDTPPYEVIRPSTFIPSMSLARLFGVPYQHFEEKNKGEKPPPVSLHKLTELLDRGSFKVIANLLAPDQFVEWGIQAARELKRRQDLNVDVVWVTGGPFGFFVAGALIAKALNKPLVLDYRDPWTTHRAPRSWWLSTPQSVLRGIEGWALRRASAVGYIHRAAYIANRAVFGQPEGSRWSVIMNSFDPIDLGDLPPRRLSEEHGAPALVYAGNFYQERSAKPVIEALIELQDLDPDSTRYPLTLHLFGQLDPPASSLLKAHPLTRARLILYPRYSAAEIGAIMRGAEALLLVIGEGGGHQLALGGKFWDYLAAGQPILGVGPMASAAKHMILENRLGLWANTNAQGELLSALKQLSQQGITQPKSANISQFHARQMSGKIAALLDYAYAQGASEGQS